MGHYNETGTISVSELLQACNTFGVPHFQRGSVWSTENVGALLESLFFDTPCGSIILWERADQNHGVPLIEGGHFKFLIIDGQQRIRSVRAAFKDTDTLTVDDVETSDGEPSGGAPPVEEDVKRFWAINLNRLDGEFGALLRRPERREHPLFVMVPDPVAAEERRIEREKKENQRRRSIGADSSRPYSIPESPYKFNFVPLRYLFNGGQVERLLTRPAFYLKAQDRQTIGPDHPSFGPVVTQLKALAERVGEMKTRQLFLKRLGADIGLDEAVRIFIRINSGGRPVQEEERAFSTLVRESPVTNQQVRRLFDLVHSARQRTGSSIESIDRDDAMRRMNERSFGFKLFIRIFILAASYHTERPLGSSSLSYRVLQDSKFLRMLDGGPDRYAKLWSVTSDVVLAARRLLGNRLRLDMLQFLPDITSLLPLFVLLLKYPDLMDGRQTDDVRAKPEFQAGLANVALLLLLGDPTGQQVMKWAGEIIKSHRDAAGEIDRLTGKLKLKRSLLIRKLRSANALTNRYTLLLYGLERSNKARDFSYSVNRLKRPPLPRRERLVEQSSAPEKQHIIPYSSLEAAYDLESKSRLGSTEANNIGNVTYISHQMNSWAGLSDRILDLANERPERNLSAHFIDKRSLRAFLKVKEAVESQQVPPSVLKKAYRTWIGARQMVIAEGFLAWVGKCEEEWTRNSQAMARNVDDRVEAVEPLVLENPRGRSLSYLIRRLHLPNRVEDILNRTFARQGWSLDVTKRNVQRAEGEMLVLQHSYKHKGRLRGVVLTSVALTLPTAVGIEPRTVDLVDTELGLKRLREIQTAIRRLTEAEKKTRAKTDSDD